jgi:hypothetical protein
MQRSFSGITSRSSEEMTVIWQRIKCSGENVLVWAITESKGDPSPGSAKEITFGVEKKLWIAKDEQPKLYSKRAQMVLDTVKVGNTISLPLESD